MTSKIDIENQTLLEIRDQATHLAEELRPVMETYDRPPYFIMSAWYVEDPDPVERQIQDGVFQLASMLSRADPDTYSAAVRSLDPTDALFLENDHTADQPGDRVNRLAALLLTGPVRRRWFSPGSVIASDPSTSPVLSVFPELRENIDDDGLFRLTPGDCTTPYGLTYKGQLILFHPFLRQRLRGGFDDFFLSALLQDLRTADNNSVVRVSLDLRRHLPVELYNPLRTRAYWYGPRITRENLDDPCAIGRTVHGRARPSFFDHICPLDRTEFYSRLEKDGRIKSLEIEEVKPVDAIDDGYVLNRYLHAERDTEAQSFRHCDGAVKVYPESAYPARHGSEIPREPRAWRKIKLFRIDGALGTERCLALIGHFFGENELVLEHFDPDLFEEVFGERIRRYHALKSVAS